MSWKPPKIIRVHLASLAEEPPYVDLVPQEQRELEQQLGEPVRIIRKNGWKTINRIPLSRDVRIQQEIEARTNRLHEEINERREHQLEQQRMENTFSKISVIILFFCLVMMFTGFAIIIFSLP